jgi:hypothetical protein
MKIKFKNILLPIKNVHNKLRLNSLCVFARNVLLFVLSLSCAHQIYPEGGAVDRIPPEIILTEPRQGELYVKKNIFHFEFSEYVDRRSFEESVFISPAGQKAPEFDWSGKEVDVILPYELKLEKTYTITIGTDVQDINNRNKMAEAFTLAFSTGNKIDSGFIHGKVYDDENFGILISAFKIDGINSDTLDPSKSLPDYTTQTNKDGEFSLKFMMDGKYRVYAIKDEYKNLLYDPGTDKIGMFYDDVILDSSIRNQRGLKAQMSVFDTSSPKLFSVETRDENHLILKFSKNIDTASINDSSFVVLDSATNNKLPVYSWFTNYSKPFSYILETGKQNNSKYLLKLSGIKDSANHDLDSSYSKYYFDGSNIQDTITPGIILWKYNDNPFQSTVRDSLGDIDINTIFTFRFNDRINKSIFGKTLSILDTTIAVPENKIFWEKNSSVDLHLSNLKFNCWYIIKIDSLVKYNGNISKNPFIFHFRTVDKSTLSSITGKLETQDKKTNYYVEASNIETKKKYKSKTEKNNFKFENITEGKYKFYSFKDTDSNGVYSFGNPFPFHKPEKFKYHKDTIKIRARWPAELELKFDE